MEKVFKDKYSQCTKDNVAEKRSHRSKKYDNEKPHNQRDHSRKHKLPEEHENRHEKQKRKIKE